MRRFSIFLLTFWLCCPVGTPAFAAIKYKRFPPCAEGAVTVKTCECHAGTSGRYHYCHAGESCDTTAGKCHK